MKRFAGVPLTVVWALACAAPAGAASRSGTLEIRLQGLFALYTPEKTPDAKGDVRYDTMYVIAPRATEPARNVMIPESQKAAFLAGSAPPEHFTAVQVPFKNLSPDSRNVPDGLHTLVIGLTKPSVHADPYPATVSLLALPCPPEQKGPVTVEQTKLAMIPVVLKAGDPRTNATMNPEIITDVARTAATVNARLDLACGERLSIEARDVRGEPVRISPAHFEKERTGKWGTRLVEAATTGVRSDDMVFTRPFTDSVQLTLNGAPVLTLYPDETGKAVVTLRALPSHEILLGKAGPPGRVDLEDFRLLYALAQSADKATGPYYFYAWRNPVSGSPFCDPSGRFVQ